ncbi:MAG: hypothetical protein J6V90_06225 [Treponema sp.]|nr:hypothetical protein [Treponema sp.]
MNFYAIKLNPSQELKLVKAANGFLGPGGPLSLDKKTGLVRQPVTKDRPIFLRPLLCVLPDAFEKEEFLSIEKFEIFAPDEMAAAALPTCFWAKITTPARILWAPIPFAIPYSLAKDFSLEKVFDLSKSFPRGDGSAEKQEREPEPFYFPSSFKLCEASASKNEWKLYDLAWKKL